MMTREMEELIEFTEESVRGFFEYNELKLATIDDNYWKYVDNLLMRYCRLSIKKRIECYAFLMSCQFEVDGPVDLECNNRKCWVVDIHYPTKNIVQKNLLKLWKYRHNFKRLKEHVKLEVIQLKELTCMEYGIVGWKTIPAFHH